jgi:hypothetical protein
MLTAIALLIATLLGTAPEPDADAPECARGERWDRHDDRDDRDDRTCNGRDRVAISNGF